MIKIIIILSSILFSFFSFQSIIFAKDYYDECSLAQQVETANFQIKDQERQKKFHPGITPLERAISSGSLEEVKRLVKNGVDINKSPVLEHPPIAFAAAHGKNDIIQYLLQKGADINASGSKALQLAVHLEQLQTAKMLIELGANVNPPITRDTRLTPLIWATQSGYFDMVKLLVSKGANINVVTFDRGTSPLMNACPDGHLKIPHLWPGQNPPP